MKTIGAKRKRKRRSDRLHLIYRLWCLDLEQSYIGLVVVKGRAVKKTLKQRWQQHQYRAEFESKDWKLSRAIRRFKNWSQECLEIVRGKAKAHVREVQLIEKYGPELNTLKKG